MINLISQGKIIRQFWDKIIRHSTDRKKLSQMKKRRVNKLLIGGGSFRSIK